MYGAGTFASSLKYSSIKYLRIISWFSLVAACIVLYKTIDSVFEVVTWLQGFISLIMPFILAVIVAYILYIPCKKVEDIIRLAEEKRAERGGFDNKIYLEKVIER